MLALAESQNKTKVGLKEHHMLLNTKLTECQNKTKVGLKGRNNLPRENCDLAVRIRLR